MYRIVCVLIGYVLGHIQTSYILGKIIKKIDIREHGSGNAGMSNSMVVMGPMIAVPVLVVDVLKSAGAFVLCSYLFGGSGGYFMLNDGLRGLIPGVYGSFGAILGHLFPVYMGFKGGKGTACLAGLLLALHIPMTGILFAIAALILIITRYVAPAVMLCLVAFPVALALFGFDTEIILIGYCITILLNFRHIGNIINIRNGTEDRIGHKIKS